MTWQPSLTRQMPWLPVRLAVAVAAPALAAQHQRCCCEDAPGRPRAKARGLAARMLPLSWRASARPLEAAVLSRDVLHGPHWAPLAAWLRSVEGMTWTVRHREDDTKLACR